MSAFLKICSNPRNLTQSALVWAQSRVELDAEAPVGLHAPGVVGPVDLEDHLPVGLGEALRIPIERRDRLAAAVRGAGMRIDHSEAGLYLCATRDEDCWTTIDRLAGLGVVAAPGSFYGSAGARHVRLALTASDERIDAAVERLR